MAIFRNGLAILALAAAALAAGCEAPEREAWLHGTWTLAYNPGHDTQDELTFREDGTVSIRTEDDRHLDGKYRVDGETLLMAVAPKPDADPVGVRFAISPDHTRLTYETGAYFTRQAAP